MDLDLAAADDDDRSEQEKEEEEEKQQQHFHVLAVDDSNLDRKLLERLLTVSSYQVTCVDSGDKALEYLGLLNIEENEYERSLSSTTSSLSNSSQQEISKVNLIMTDYSMPGISGYDLLKRIKDSNSWKDVPVVVMSSENVPSRINMCLEGGAEEFLLKPVKLSDLRKLHSHLQSPITHPCDHHITTVDEKSIFQEFFIKWKDEQNNQLQDLITASETWNPLLTDSSLAELVGQVMGHYREYYQVKSNWAKTEVLDILSPPWNTPLEDAYLWVGGWRPTTAFHLLYSKSGLQLKAQLSYLATGPTTGNLDHLSSGQLGQIDKLQRSTIQEERDITEKMAKHQERVADMEMVGMSHDASQSSRVDHERVDSVLKPKEEGFRSVLQSADDLRITTLKAVIEILSPIQAIHFLIAAAELHLRLHDWGKDKEEKQAASAYPTTSEASSREENI